MTITATRPPRPRAADPRATTCRYCGRPGATLTAEGREHAACAARVAAYRAAEAERHGADLAAAYNAFRAERRAAPRPR